ncbi:MAG: homocysteine S-methyltransferase family protein [Phycisphaeraceae bacterium]|nr:homocysteine S-methyltransferase family protein [Phycisphaeraceae bacterium]
MARPDLLKLLAQRTVLCDGGMGTQLIAAGMSPGEPSARWNLDHAEVVQAVHRRYRQAGCDLVTTNTFQATRTALAQHGLEAQTRAINLAAAKNARLGAGEETIVLADVGPFGGFLEPMGETTEDELSEIFTEQLIALRDGGCDAVIVETMGDPNEAAVAVRAAKKLADWPVIATFAFARTGGVFRTMMGTMVEQALGALREAGAEVVGANCGTDLELEDYVELAREVVKAAGDARAIMQPNAGAPKLVDGRSVHPATAGQMAGFAAKYVGAGLAILGGCCGTTPEHLRAMAAVVKK